MPTFFSRLEDVSDTDRFTVSLTAGLQYFIELEPASISGGSPVADPFVSIRVDGQPVLAFDDNGGVDLAARIVFVPTESRDYVVEVEDAAGLGGDYRLTVEQDDLRSSVEGVGQAGAVRGGVGFGEIDYAGDGDIHGVTLIADLSYTIEARGADSGAGSLPDPSMALFDAGGGFITSDDDAGRGRDARLVVVSGETATLFVQVGSSDGLGGYIVAVGPGRGGSGDDRIVGTARPDAIDGRDGDDLVRGGTGGDRLLGGDGDDLLVGDNGRDTLYGGDGADVLRGGASGDALRGGRGADILIGGLGADLFVFGLRDSPRSAPDTLRAGNGAIAFELPGGPADEGDRFDFSRIDANRDADGDQAFRFGGAGAGRISLADRGSDTLVRANVDADAAFEIALLIDDGRTRAEDYNAGDVIL